MGVKLEPRGVTRIIDVDNSAGAMWTEMRARNEAVAQMAPPSSTVALATCDYSSIRRLASRHRLNNSPENPAASSGTYSITAGARYVAVAATI